MNFLPYHSPPPWTRYKGWAHVVPSWRIAASHSRGPRSMGNGGSCHLCKTTVVKKSSKNCILLLWNITQCNFYLGVATQPRRLQLFMLYPAASQVVAMPPRRPFLAALGPHVPNTIIFGSMGPVFSTQWARNGFAHITNIDTLPKVIKWAQLAAHTHNDSITIIII